MNRILALCLLLAGCLPPTAPAVLTTAELWDAEVWTWACTIAAATDKDAPAPAPPGPAPSPTACLCANDPAFPCQCTASTCTCEGCRVHRKNTGMTSDEMKEVINDSLNGVIEAFKKAAAEARAMAKAEEPPALPPAPTPAPAMAPPLCVSINGEDVEVEPFIQKWWRAGWHFPDYGRGNTTSDENHLVEHGVARGDLAKLTADQKDRLHNALHGQASAAPRQAATKAPVTRAPAPAGVQWYGWGNWRQPQCTGPGCNNGARGFFGGRRRR